MNNYSNIVPRLPLETLFTEKDWTEAHYIKELTKNEIKELLKESSVQFVIADVGEQLTWIELAQCFKFWKSEVQKHLVGDSGKIYFEDFPDEYAYRPALWMTENKQSIVVLEKLH